MHNFNHFEGLEGGPQALTQTDDLDDREPTSPVGSEKNVILTTNDLSSH